MGKEYAGQGQVLVLAAIVGISGAAGPRFGPADRRGEIGLSEGESGLLGLSAIEQEGKVVPPASQTGELIQGGAGIGRVPASLLQPGQIEVAVGYHVGSTVNAPETISTARIR